MNKFIFSGSLQTQQVTKKNEKLQNPKNIHVTEIFLDSGCTSLALIDIQFCNWHNIPLIPLPTPIPLTLGDNSLAPSGPIIFKTPTLFLHLGEHSEPISFLATNIAWPIILGLPWLSLHNPTPIDWVQGTLTFGQHCQAAGHCEAPCTISARTTPPAQFLTLIECALVDREDLSAQLSAILSHHDIEPSGCALDDRGVPLTHSRFASSVFKLKEEVIPLPPHRDHDLKIDFTPGSTMPRPAKVYPLSKEEDSRLYDYLQDALRRGWIIPSSSPIASPCFFVAKPNGGKRLCVDYRRVNSITIKDRYPIPLFQVFLDDFAGSVIFTQLDLPDAYHLVRIAKGDEFKTAFITRFGVFAYQVISFGLTNAPAAFQKFMDTLFASLIAQGFVKIYLDNIFIHSKRLEDHDGHVAQVLAILEDAKLFINPKKCTFSVPSIDFLGFIVSVDGLKMHPDKQRAVIDWPTPTSSKEVVSFVAFANFYRRFIPRFSEITKPLTNLSKKGVPFSWDETCAQAFNELKTTFQGPPILHYFDPTKPLVMETDASDVGIAGVLSQINDDGILQPISFYSRSLLAVGERFYTVYDKELLAIVEGFRFWRHYLIAADPNRPTVVISDHANLVYFSTSQSLSQRQIRWSQQLSKFHFEIVHRVGSLNGKADLLSRRPDFLKTVPDGKLVLRLFQFQNRVDISALSILSSDSSFLDKVRLATSSSPLFKQFDEGKLAGNDYRLVDGLLYLKGRLLIPTLELQLQVLASRHDSPTAGHFGVRKTIELIRRDFSWQGLDKTVQKYIRSCEICTRNKPQRHKPLGLLQPLPIPMERWTDLTCDFITDLPLSSGYDSILVFKDRLSKMCHFIACTKSISAAETAELFLRFVFVHHGCPKSIYSDRGPQFISIFWKRLFELIGTKVDFTTAHHQEANGSTEIVNQVIEAYLRIYCSFQQDDWFHHITLAEFCYNNTVHATTGFTPFFACNGFHPIFDPTMITSSTVPSAEDRARDITSTLEELKANMAVAQQRYTLAANKSRMAHDLKVGDLVFLNRKNIKTIRPSRKLDTLFFGPFKIVECVNPVSYRLDLPHELRRIHPVFHVSLLHPQGHDLFPSSRPPPPPVELIDDHEEYVVSAILDSKFTNRRKRKVLYLIQWEGYSDEYNTWEPLEHLNNSLSLVHSFHDRNPGKPGFRSLPGGD